MQVRIKNSKGYLTLDMLAALGIAAIIIGITVPNLSSFFKDLGLKKEVQKLSASISSLITKAANEKRTIQFNLESHGYYATTGQSNQEIITARTLPKKYNLEFSNTVKQIKFHERGVCSPASISITNGSSKCSLTLSLRCRLNSSCSL